MNVTDQLDDIQIRMLHPGTTYKENVTEDMPRLMAALRAVLDLHEQMKPRELKGESACAYCSDEDYADWPCDTVQAIESRLA